MQVEDIHAADDEELEFELPHGGYMAEVDELLPTTVGFSTLLNFTFTFLTFEHSDHISGQ